MTDPTDELIAQISANEGGHPATQPDSLDLLGTFTLLEANPVRRRPREFTAILTNAPVVTSGYGGWSRVARPRDSAITEWVGRDTLSVTINFVLDDFASGRGVYIESKCQILEELAGVDAGNPEPPLLELHSNPPSLMPHGYERASHNLWFIEGITWDQEQIRYNRAGNRIRAVGSVIVSVHVEDVRLSPAEEIRAHGKPVTKHGSKRKTYRVVPGDTLHKIAARRDTYNDWHKWKLIARANHIRGHKRLKAGRVLILP